MALQCQQYPSFLLSSCSTYHRMRLSSTSPQLGCSDSSLISTFQAGRRKEQGGKGNAGIRKAALSLKSPRRLLLRSHWPEPNHLAIDNCRRGHRNCSENLNFGPEAVTVWCCLCREQRENGRCIATGTTCLVPHL